MATSGTYRYLCSQCWLILMIVFGCACVCLTKSTGQEPAEVHVVYACDANQFVGLLASMTSLTEHLDPGTSYTIHIFTPKQDKTQLMRMVGECFAIGQKDVQVQLYETPLPPSSVADFIASQNANVTARVDLLLPEAFARVYLHDYLPGLRKVLWLDTDTIVKADVGQLFKTDMNHALAAVTYGPSFNLNRYLTERSPGFQVDAVGGPGSSDPNSEVFNTGVLLFDVEQWRSGQFARSAEAWMKLLAGRDTEADQLLINLAVGGRFDRLDAGWNLVNLGLTEENRTMKNWDFVEPETLQHASILHWTGKNKPWLQEGQQRSNHYISWFAPYDHRETCAYLKTERRNNFVAREHRSILVRREQSSRS